MKNTMLKTLAKEILLYSEQPLAKVRFAKVIYFVFKSLVIHKKYKVTDLAFIRMPLGPVPYDFMNLSEDSDFGVEESAVGLMYNRQSYYLKNKTQFKESSNADVIKAVLSKLSSFSTSSLVEYSHLDPSWINNVNGANYYINSDDLKQSLPKSGRPLDLIIDNQLLQARLLSGAENDAVVDSTNLEYPEYIDA